MPVVIIHVYLVFRFLNFFSGNTRKPWSRRTGYIYIHTAKSFFILGAVYSFIVLISTYSKMKFNFWSIWLTGSMLIHVYPLANFHIYPGFTNLFAYSIHDLFDAKRCIFLTWLVTGLGIKFGFLKDIFYLKKLRLVAAW